MAVKAATAALIDFATPSLKRGNRGFGIITQK